MRNVNELLDKFTANPWALSFISFALTLAVVGRDRLPFA
jgi:hypothetical protein